MDPFPGATLPFVGNSPIRHLHPGIVRRTGLRGGEVGTGVKRAERSGGVSPRGLPERVRGNTPAPSPKQGPSSWASSPSRSPSCWTRSPARPRRAKWCRHQTSRSSPLPSGIIEGGCGGIQAIDSARDAPTALVLVRPRNAGSSRRPCLTDLSRLFLEGPGGRSLADRAPSPDPASPDASRPQVLWAAVPPATPIRRHGKALRCTPSSAASFLDVGWSPPERTRQRGAPLPPTSAHFIQEHWRLPQRSSRSRTRAASCAGDRTGRVDSVGL